MSERTVYDIFNQRKTMKVVTAWEKPQCPECQDYRVDKRYLDFTPNAKVLNDVYVCMTCGCEFILQTPSLNANEKSRSKTE